MRPRPVDPLPGTQSFEKAVAVLRALTRASILSAFDLGRPPILRRRDAVALLPWIADASRHSAAHARAVRKIDQVHLVTEPGPISASAAHAITAARPERLTPRHILAAMRARLRLDRRGLARPDARRMHLLATAALADPALQLWLAQTVRGFLLDKVVFHPAPAPAPLARLNAAAIWPIVALASDDGRSVSARRLRVLLRRHVQRQFAAPGWAGFWDMFVLLHLIGEDGQDPMARTLDQLTPLPFDPAMTAPHFVARNWAEAAPDYALRYLRGEII